MIYQWFVMWVFIYPIYAQQYYDKTCSSHTNFPGTRYTCNSFNSSCTTFLIYRAKQNLQTISNISTLFNMIPKQLLTLNNITSPYETLKQGREVLVPINCSCLGQFFQANFSYSVPAGTINFAEIACGTFEGLVKSITLAEQNPSHENNSNAGFTLHVPLKCACPDNVSTSAGVKYLVTYPFFRGDNTNKLAQKFGVDANFIWAVNNLDYSSTVFPNTTVLVPLIAEPSINFNIPDPQPSAPSFLPTVPVLKTTKNAQIKKLYVAGLTVGFCLVVLTLIVCGLYVKVLKKWKAKKFHSFNHRSSTTTCSTPRSSPLPCATTRNSTNSCLSPDLLVDLKYTLFNYSTEELKRATKDFNEEYKLSGHVYKGVIHDGDVVIKQMRFEDTREVIDVHSKINHVNIVKLLGVCYGESDLGWSYLVFEFPTNGSLRNYLSNSSISLRWHRRTQIAFDIATGLHYLHYCMVPRYTHVSINSRNIFLTAKFRAKLAAFGTTTLEIGTSKECEKMASVKGFVDGLTPEKLDIFAFGVVLLELISAREDVEKECIGFLGGGGSEGGCFEQLRSFMDPCLREDYPLSEALCLAVLAKACLEDDPLHRPSMDDIIKVLARMIPTTWHGMAAL